MKIRLLIASVVIAIVSGMAAARLEACSQCTSDRTCGWSATGGANCCVRNCVGGPFGVSCTCTICGGLCGGGPPASNERMDDGKARAVLTVAEPAPACGQEVWPLSDHPYPDGSALNVLMEKFPLA